MNQFILFYIKKKKTTIFSWIKKRGQKNIVLQYNTFSNIYGDVRATQSYACYRGHSILICWKTKKKTIKVCYLQNPMISINLRTFYLGTISLFSWFFFFTSETYHLSFRSNYYSFLFHRFKPTRRKASPNW